jgi:hypothetical protein
MWKPRRLTTLWASKACYWDSFVSLRCCILTASKVTPFLDEYQQLRRKESLETEERYVIWSLIFYYPPSSEWVFISAGVAWVSCLALARKWVLITAVWGEIFTRIGYSGEPGSDLRIILYRSLWKLNLIQLDLKQLMPNDGLLRDENTYGFHKSRK